MKISYLDGRPDEEKDFTVTFGDQYGWMDGMSWTMEVNLTQMCKDAGKKVKEKVKDWDGMWTDVVYVAYPVPKLKKVLKLMCKYAAEDTLGEVQKFLDEHFPKWGTEFRKMR